MNDSPTVKTLFLHYQQRLSLYWITGQEGELRPLGSSEQTPGMSLIGHLNNIHPNRLQILGQLEIEYLNNLNDNMRQNLIEQLCNNQPAAIILTENLNTPADLKSLCEQTHTPLLGSSHSSVKFISNLQYYLESELAEKTTIHGVFLEVSGMGVLLTGKSNVGKSELALELITRGHRLIADDAPEFSRAGPDTIRGQCPAVLINFLEVRGLGILNIQAMYGDSAIKLSKDLRLIVNLERLSPDSSHKVNRLQGSYQKRIILDTEIPEVTIPVASGRNLAVLVEAAVRDHILYRKGYNASDAFIDRQRELINQKTNN